VDSVLTVENKYENKTKDKDEKELPRGLIGGREYVARRRRRQ
jgi:hypothetical protein